jgi:formylglycine-generating enzyme required for sulfatase activity
VPGGTFYRGYDLLADSLSGDTKSPATLSNFRLDTYEVTVGRFRQFVAAGMGTQQSAPAAGAGAHAAIASSGWDATWNANLVADTAALVAGLKCQAPPYISWTDAPGANEDLPIGCLTWYEAMAFCAWDEGYLPTEAEWNYAGAGGSEQRAYPWSSPPASPTIDCTYADYYYCDGMGVVDAVGSKSPKGDGKWGQADLGGNLWEWTLDWHVSPYPNPCNDCASLTGGTLRVARGGGLDTTASVVRNVVRSQLPPDMSFRGFYAGVRCARTP